MTTQFSARHSLFLFVRTHRQLQYYFGVAETRRSANQSALALRGPVNPQRIGNVVEIHPDRRSSSAI